jgi:hypothetical protein
MLLFRFCLFKLLFCNFYSDFCNKFSCPDIVTYHFYPCILSLFHSDSISVLIHSLVIQNTVTQSCHTEYRYTVLSYIIPLHSLVIQNTVKQSCHTEYRYTVLSYRIPLHSLVIQNTVTQSCHTEYRYTNQYNCLQYLTDPLHVSCFFS